MSEPENPALQGALRVLVAACNRLDGEAEECEWNDGCARVAALDFWHEFEAALARANAVISQEPEPIPHTKPLDREAIRNAALEEAARAVTQHDKAGREWVRASLWDTLSREVGQRIRALKCQSAQPVEEPAGLSFTSDWMDDSKLVQPGSRDVDYE